GAAHEGRAHGGQGQSIRGDAGGVRADGPLLARAAPRGPGCAGGGRLMGAQGTGLLDFGAFPGASDASLVVAGQAGILAGSLVEAWLLPAATADHTADEHIVETLKVFAGNIVPGTGFTLYGVNDSQLSETPPGWQSA